MALALQVERDLGFSATGKDLGWLVSGKAVLVALTGTPGTGKSAISAHLEEKGIRICDLNELAGRCGALGSYDPERESWNVDMKVLERSLPKERPLIVVGHLSHLLPVDLSIVLRCHPNILRERLEARGWPPSKVRENVEAEALGVVTQEAMEKIRVFELDTTAASPEEAAKAVYDILSGRGKGREAPEVDWTEVILSWY